MRFLSLGLIVLALACAHDDGPLPLDGASYVLTSSSEGPPPVLANRIANPADGSTRTDYIVADRISFLQGTGRVLRTLTSSQVVETPGSPAQTFTGTGYNNGNWGQSGDKIVISWEYFFGGYQSTVVDTLQLVNGQLHAHWSRQGCAECGAQGVDVTYVRDRQR